MSVSTTRFNGVLTLTLNNPTRANALSPTMVAELIKELDKAEKDDDVRVLVLTGEGLFFSAGMDLAAASKGSGAPFDTALSIFKRIAEFPKPTIARINGPALGGGVGLVFATDFRIAIDSSFIQLAEVKRGLIPAIISLYIVPQLGPSLSRAFFLTGEKVPIQRLHQAGIIYSIATSPTHLDESVSSLAALLIEGGPSAQSTIKQLIRVVSGSESEDSKVRHVKSVFEGMMKSKEAAYGMKAFLSKQKPDWAAFKKGTSKL